MRLPQPVRNSSLPSQIYADWLLQDFDLSRLRSLRSLEVTASSILRIRRNTPSLLCDITSTITSPVFSEVILVFQRLDLYCPNHIPFDMLRQMHSKRKFRLVFCLEAAKKYRDHGREVMLRKVSLGPTYQPLDFLTSRPTFETSERNSWTG